jgi:protease-4
VLAQWPEVTELMGKLGIKFQEVKSGELKASPTPFKPMDERSRQVMQDTIDDGFRWFVNLVETRRGIKIDEVPGLREGRIYSGREALTHRLVDEIGGEREAVLWLEREKGVPPNLKVVSWKPESENPWSLLRAEEGGLTGLLADGIAGGLRRVVGADTSLSTLGLDGLISVWQPGEK